MQANLISSIFATVAPASFATALAFLLIAVVYFFVKNKDLPPGPVGLPYFGYWPFLTDANCTSKLESFKKKYGDIFSFTSTGRLFINLGSFKAVREACVTKSEYFGNRVAGYNVVNRLFKDGKRFFSNIV
ncbi:hypothetical protein AVEN_125553-1 [Araneus ventricosus]|uniref:Cytochrome P450 18a1 n=2 Tax=Araneus ventricosus TaxID=182803 RepID=A0A4Y2QPK3_ARAVE|nr:hypothetical protein AVEN_59930-1 [Araneus ventricosus]GBN65295.1 hypothetical protein AVEN_66672-1 [Araneus ventricosus]GBN65308.1 hypothetical protein AVEN_125553-1 [Araneus ventricosus]